ncbi:MAG: PIN domain-containing protein [Holophagaceae bacterium]|nr:PIN domain-containing protein [Holophagaceae bacterium]
MSQEKKLKVYIDTSIISHLYADDRPDWMEITWRLWDKFATGEYEIFISDVFYDEVDQCPQPKRGWMYEKLGLIPFQDLEESEEVLDIADQLRIKGVLSEKKLNDRLHIAYALFHNCDVILSWNFSDIVKDATRNGVKLVNATSRYKEIQIVSPEQFIEGGSQ